MDTPLTIVLADDNKDDVFLFMKALNEIPEPTDFIAIGDGEKLIHYLSGDLPRLPDVVFLDLNMPRKTGLECLTEIKQNEKLKRIPVVMYSSSFHKDILDLFYDRGASRCIRKSTNAVELAKALLITISEITTNKNVQIPRDKFLLDFVKEEQNKN